MEKTLEKVWQHLEHAKRFREVSFWVGLVGEIIVMVNQIFGYHLNATEFTAVTALVATLIISGHLTASAIFDTMGRIVEAIHINSQPAATETTATPKG